MFNVYGTKRLLHRIKRRPYLPLPTKTILLDPPCPSVADSGTALGDWHAQLLFWKREVVLFVNERTLLPVLVPIESSVKVLDRFPFSLSELLHEIGVDRQFISKEIEAMVDPQLCKTSDRSMTAILNEYSFLAEHAIEFGFAGRLIDLSWWLAKSSQGSLLSGHGSPDQEVLALTSALLV